MGIIFLMLTVLFIGYGFIAEMITNSISRAIVIEKTKRIIFVIFDFIMNCLSVLLTGYYFDTAGAVMVVKSKIR